MAVAKKVEVDPPMISDPGGVEHSVAVKAAREHVAARLRQLADERIVEYGQALVSQPRLLDSDRSWAWGGLRRIGEMYETAHRLDGMGE